MIAIDVAENALEEGKIHVRDLDELISGRHGVFALVLVGVLPEGNLQVDDAPQPLKQSFSDDLIDPKQAEWL